MSNSSAQKIKSKPTGLIKSPLLRPIIGAFLFLIALELALVFYLLHDIQQAEQTALREYQYLTASERWSDCADLMRAHRKVVDATRNSDDRIDAKRKHDASARAVKESIRALKVSTESTGKLDSTATRQAIDACLYCTTEMYDLRRTVDERDRWYGAYLNTSKRMYDKVLLQIRTIHAEIGSHRTSKYQEELLLGSFLLVDLAVCFGLASFIERRITRPLSELATSCEKLRAGEVLPAPERESNEIDFLQRTFHDMSVSIFRLEQGRRSYIELFKQMHASRLLRVRELIADLTRGAQGRALDKLTILEGNVGRTLYLLDTMTQGLSFNAGKKLAPDFELKTSTELFQTVKQTLAFMLKNKSISLQVIDPACELSIDAQLMGRAITNLLGNACKFSPKGSEIVLAGQSDGQRFRCEIRDQGPGISKEQQERLFQRFSQLEQTQKGGSGLGLLIAKQIVESHGGTIGCTSEEGKGTTFWFEIPTKRDSSESNAQLSRAEDLKNISVHGSKKNGSIRTYFVAILTVFVLAQFVIAFQLNSSLQQAAKRANGYTNQKASIVETQRFVALFLSWRQRSFEAAVARDKSAIIRLFPLFAEQATISEELLRMAAPGSKLKDIFTRLHKNVNNVIKIGVKLQSIESLPPLQAFPMLSVADKLGQQIETDLFEALKVQNVALDRSYDLTTELRATVTQLIMLTLIINSVLILVLFITCINIIDRLAQVNAKALSFSQGDEPVATVKGNDELAYLDQRLCDAAHAIREAEAQRRELLAIINHDLRTPLTAMLMGIELLTMEHESGKITLNINEQSKPRFVSVSHDVEFLIKQISDLLDLEKMESGALELDAADLVIDELLEDTIDSMKRRAKQRVEFVRHGDTEDLWVRGELPLLRRVFEALIENAMTYSVSDSDIKVSIGSDERWAIINVSDKGSGINKELLEHLFDRFRFSAGAPVTGVGLPLAFRLVKLHGGNLEVRSSSEEGTNATIFLPKLIR